MSLKVSPKTSKAMMEASRWYAKLASDEVSEAEMNAWTHWKSADEENKLAWQRLEDVNQAFKNVSPKIAFQTLNTPNLERRRAIKQLAVLFGAGTVAYYTYNEQPWRGYIADNVTKTGEQRNLQLADGTQIHLNTNSAINIHFSDSERLIELVKGEVLIETGHEQSAVYRPFKVRTQHGTAEALGTKFTVRDFDTHSKVSVFEGAVQIKPKQQAATILLNKGESATFNKAQSLSTGKARETDTAWTKGILVAYAMPLSEFVEELARYRTGILRCHPSIADLVISGSFPIQNSDEVLAKLSRILPVQVETYTRYWVNVVPAK